MKCIELIYDPEDETAEECQARVDEAIEATGLPSEDVTVIVREIVHCIPPTVSYCGNA